MVGRGQLNGMRGGAKRGKEGIAVGDGVEAFRVVRESVEWGEEVVRR